jgi:hypothetical protein
MREEEINRKLICAVPIGRCWRGPTGEANERGREKRKEHKSASLRLHHSVTPLEGEKPGMTKIIGNLQNITFVLVKDLKNYTNF